MLESVVIVYLEAFGVELVRVEEPSGAVLAILLRATTCYSGL